MRGVERSATSYSGCSRERQSFRLRPFMCRISVSVVGTFHHQIQKPELVSGFFTSAVCARTGGASRLCLASVTPHISPFLALFGLSVLQFYLLASRACARSLPVLARVLGQRVVAGNSCSGGDRAQGCPPKCKRARDLSPFCARFVIGKNGA